MAVSGYRPIWESKQYYRTLWSTDYLQQGHIDPNFFLYHFFYFCRHFLAVSLTIKLLSVHSPSIWFVASLLRLAVRVIIKLAGRLAKGQMMRGAGAVSQGPVSSLLKVSAKVVWKREEHCTMYNPDSKCHQFPIHLYLLGEEDLRDFRAKSFRTLVLVVSLPS